MQATQRKKQEGLAHLFPEEQTRIKKQLYAKAEAQLDALIRTLECIDGAHRQQLRTAAQAAREGLISNVSYDLAAKNMPSLIGDHLKEKLGRFYQSGLVIRKQTKALNENDPFIRR